MQCQDGIVLRKRLEERERTLALQDARAANEALAAANRRVSDVLDELALVRASLAAMDRPRPLAKAA